MGRLWHHCRPVAYQETAGRRQLVASRYTVSAAGEVGFAVGSYDRSRPLVIDPQVEVNTSGWGARPKVKLTYSTFLAPKRSRRVRATGISEELDATGIATDAGGHA